MFAFIKGILADSTPQKALIDCHGVGYEILIPPNVFCGLPQLGKEVLLHTSFVVKEQSQALYGFLQKEEKSLFEELLKISGIGPKSALGLIGHMPGSLFRDAVIKGDITLICKTPGIGKKTAERLLIEMRDKLSNKKQKTPSTWQIEVRGNPTVHDAMMALVNLGYDQTTAEKALKASLEGNPECSDLAKLITTALQHV